MPLGPRINAVPRWTTVIAVGTVMAVQDHTRASHTQRSSMHPIALACAARTRGTEERLDL